MKRVPYAFQASNPLREGFRNDFANRPSPSVRIRRRGCGRKGGCRQSTCTCWDAFCCGTGDHIRQVGMRAASMPQHSAANIHSAALKAPLPVARALHACPTCNVCKIYRHSDSTLQLLLLLCFSFALSLGRRLCLRLWRCCRFI